MKLLVTGSKGFMGKNLIAELKNQKYLDILEYDTDTDPLLLDKFCKKVDFVFHLAGVNRPSDEKEFMEGNYELTSALLANLKKHKNKCPIVFTSSIQAIFDNPYGASKKAGEDLIINCQHENGNRALIYRLPNVFGKWCRPNYNSVVATFCHNIANDLPININDENKIMNLVYIDDLMKEFTDALKNKKSDEECFFQVPISYYMKLGDIADLIYSFKKCNEDFFIPGMADDFARKLYSTYLSYVPKNKLKRQLTMNMDSRGSFSEFIKTSDRGQISVNISKPGITKGNHWHHSKNEKFLVVYGYGVIRLRNIYSEEVIEFFVSGEKLEVVEIPPGYTHNIENLGRTDMVTIMWVNEIFNTQKPDTYYMEV